MFRDEAQPPLVLGSMLVGLLLTTVGIVVLPKVPSRLVASWIVAASTTALVCWLLVAYVVNPQISTLVIALLFMVSFGPVVSAWPPFVAASMVMMGTLAWAISDLDPAERQTWLVGAVCGMTMSATLLLMRWTNLRRLDAAMTALERTANHDRLTGLLNRHGLAERLDATWADARRRKEPITVTFMDLSGLKKANDTHGHHIGDAALIEAAAAITDTVRANDLVGRWGGDEFVVVGIGDPSSADDFADRVNASFAAKSQARRDNHIGAISVGRASAPAASVTFHELVDQADADMYARRRDGSVKEDVVR